MNPTEQASYDKSIQFIKDELGPSHEKINRFLAEQKFFFSISTIYRWFQERKIPNEITVTLIEGATANPKLRKQHIRNLLPELSDYLK